MRPVEIAGDSEGLVAPERRHWSLRDAAMFMVVRANDDRATELRALGEMLIANAHHHLDSTRDDTPTEWEADTGDSSEQQLAEVRLWASSLDRDRYQAHEVPGGLSIQVTPPEDIAATLQYSSEALEREQDATRLVVRYYIERNKQPSKAIGPDDLTADITIARGLLESQLSLGAFDPWDTAALVVAAALEAHLLNGADLPDEALSFAVDTLLRIGEGEVQPRQDDVPETYFDRGADRSAARALPLLLLPVAAPLRTVVDEADGQTAFERATSAGINLGRAVAYEVRLHLARGLDHVWEAPCTEGGLCHHRVGLQLTTETMRDCVRGDWPPGARRPSVVTLEDPVRASLANTDDASILSFRLDAAIRALAPAATANICISTQARVLLLAVLDAQRRSLLSHEDRDADARGTQTLVSARALLTLAEHGDDASIYAYIDAYADNSTLLDNLLRALSAAAEETQNRAATARRIWPDVVRHVLELKDSGHAPFQDPHYGDGDRVVAALIPNPTGNSSYLYPEVHGDRIPWWDPLALQSEVEQWLAVAAGRATCVDQLISFLDVLAPEDRVRTGLPWVAKLVLADPDCIARGAFSPSDWLIEMRSAAIDAGLSASWQEVVDALVVSGVTRLAPYSE